MNLKRMLRTTFLSMLFLAAFQQMNAQNKTIKGTVADEKNIPVPGASITVKGSPAGTAADAQGNFTLVVPAAAKVIVISSVGFADQELSIGNKTTFAITLSTPGQALNEVVVIGYGTAKKKDLTGAISTISNKDLKPGADNQSASADCRSCKWCERNPNR